jgi:glycerol-3-phosphate dehydrogenase
MVHGGVRYLARLQLGLVREAVRERERLVRAGAGLVHRLDFVVPILKSRPVPHGTSAGAMALALSLYQGFAGQYPVARRLNRASIESLAWGLDPDLVRGAFCYSDAQTMMRAWSCACSGKAASSVAGQ